MGSAQPLEQPEHPGNQAGQRPVSVTLHCMAMGTDDGQATARALCALAFTGKPPLKRIPLGRLSWVIPPRPAQNRSEIVTELPPAVLATKRVADLYGVLEVIDDPFVFPRGPSFAGPDNPCPAQDLKLIIASIGHFSPLSGVGVGAPPGFRAIAI
jgi:hypothetical protein